MPLEPLLGVSRKSGSQGFSKRLAAPSAPKGANAVSGAQWQPEGSAESFGYQLPYPSCFNRSASSFLSS